jgi:hypothetical protein
MTKFRGTIELGGKTATGTRIPPEVAASLGTSERPPENPAIDRQKFGVLH